METPEDLEKAAQALLREARLKTDEALSPEDKSRREEEQRQTETCPKCGCN